MTKRLFDYKEGEDFEAYVLIKSADARVARNGKPFIAFTFQDQSGTMNGMFWSATEEQKTTFQPGRVVQLRGKRTNYNGQPQVQITGLRVGQEPEPVDPHLYMESIEMGRDEIEQELQASLALVMDPVISDIVQHILKQTGEKYFDFPAAMRNHHAVAGGLSFHSITMLRIARSLLEIYPQLNSSLLLAGVILHDIGKTVELSGPMSTEYTLEGQLIGHIVIAAEMIDEAARELTIDPESEQVLALKHVILAHHGKLEYGSPVTPRILEAQILHHIDHLDATMDMMTNALSKTEPGNFSQKIFPLENRAFYKPKFVEETGHES